MNYGVVVVSVGAGCIGIELVVSTGVVVTVSVVDGIVDDESIPIEVESVVMGGADVSEPVVFSGVSQPTVAIAKKAMKRMLFMSVCFCVN